MAITLPRVNTSRGAPMGRSNDHISGKCRLEKVAMYDGGYDKGGAYWGSGVQLWVCEDADGGLFFVRAETREKAKQAIIADMLSDDVTFFR